jgi:succinate dehydrogenase / fumarate reductase iron-sulfur subunit
LCGSDGLNINGVNRLGCMTHLDALRKPIVIQPLPALPIVKDLVVDMDNFLDKYSCASHF